MQAPTVPMLKVLCRTYAEEVCVHKSAWEWERDGERLTFNFPGALLKHTDRGLPAYAAVSMWLLFSICSRAGEGGNHLVKNMPAGLTTVRPHCQNDSDLTYGAISAPVCVWEERNIMAAHTARVKWPRVFPAAPPTPPLPLWMCARHSVRVHACRLLLQRLLPVWAAPLTFTALAWRSLGKNNSDCGDCGCLRDSVALKGHTWRSETGGKNAERPKYT